MHFKSFFYFLFFSLLLLFSACEKNIRKNTATNKNAAATKITHAKGFDYTTANNRILLTIKSPYLNAKTSFQYLLSKQKNEAQNSLQIPLKSIVVTSTTHIAMLELLGVENALVGFPNTRYISSKKTQERIEKELVKELGNEENINTEVLLNLQPNLVVGFSLNSNNKMFANIEKMGIPVILNGDWLEETPLGRAEWIKFFGLLFDKEKKADSIFKHIEKNYLQAKKLAANAKENPTILSGGLFKDIWNLPAGNSFEATFLKDANTQYLWQHSQGKGSLSLSIESVFEKGKNATVWLSPSYHSSLQELQNAHVIYPQFKAFKNKNVYSYVGKRGAKGGITYFELAPSRPDLVLKDIIKIAHPKLLPNYNMTFFEKLQ